MASTASTPVVPAAPPQAGLAPSGEAASLPRRPHLRRRIILAAAAALLGVVTLGTWWAKPQSAPVALVVQRDFAQTVVASGRVEAPHRVSVASQILGTVVDVPVQEGQTVAAGQLLVQLEPRELRAVAAQAELAIEQARLRLRSIETVQRPVAEQAVRQAGVSLDNARSARERAGDLFRQGFIGQAALDDAQKAVDLADSQLRSAAKQLDALKAGGPEQQLAESALAAALYAADAAQARLAYARIVAAAPGVLIARDVERGDVVQAGRTLMTLSPLGATELVVQIDERNLAHLRLGQAARASTDAFPARTFAAEVNYISPGIDAQRGSIEVKLRVAAPPDYLRQDMTVSIDIEVETRKAAILVPAGAVQGDEARPWVLRVEDGGVVRQRAVRTGLRGNGFVEILEGLAPGDRVVAASAKSVQPGDRVRAVAQGG
jgi:HlyD family secretion protein